MNVELIQISNYSMGEKAYIQAKHLLYRIKDSLTTNNMLEDDLHIKKANMLDNLLIKSKKLHKQKS